MATSRSPAKPILPRKPQDWPLSGSSSPARSIEWSRSLLSFLVWFRPLWPVEVVSNDWSRSP